MIICLFKFRLEKVLLVYSVAFLSVSAIAWAASIRYDQSQLGDYNVQIHLKNIELYAILDDGSANGEYDYDYTDLTEKPTNNSNGVHNRPTQQQTWTAHNVTSTLQPSSTASPPVNPNNNNYNYNYVDGSANSNHSSNAVGAPLNIDVSSIIQDTAASLSQQIPPYPQPSIIHPSNYPQHQYQQQQNQQQQQVHNENSSNALMHASPTADSNLRLTRKCAPGFYKDNLGRCRRIRKPHLPFLQMVHTPGVIKSFQPLMLETNSSTTAKSITSKQ